MNADPLEQAVAVVALMREGSRKWSSLGDDILALGSASELLRGSTSGQQELRLDDSVATEHDVESARREVEGWAAEGINVVPLGSPTYPVNLRSVSARPPALFVRGDLVEADAGAIAIVGSREASGDRRNWAAAVAAACASKGVTVVSGLAEGIDTAAHCGALEAGGRTIGVLGSGLRQMYPASNRDLAAKMAYSGAVISQFWPDQRPSRTTFPRRNAVISGLSACVLVAEGRQGSGTQIAAEAAARQGRPLLVSEHLQGERWVAELQRKHWVIGVADPADVTDKIAAILGQS